jgi:hypothetical protein
MTKAEADSDLIDTGLDNAVSPQEDDELRRLHYLSKLGPLSRRSEQRIIELRLRDRREEIREPREFGTEGDTWVLDGRTSARLQSAFVEPWEIEQLRVAVAMLPRTHNAGPLSRESAQEMFDEIERLQRQNLACGHTVGELRQLLAESDL